MVMLRAGLRWEANRNSNLDQMIQKMFNTVFLLGTFPPKGLIRALGKILTNVVPKLRM